MRRYTNFITNSGTETENLKNRLTELISKSEELKFLIGFFYFSGIRELYNALNSTCNIFLKACYTQVIQRDIMCEAYYAQVGLMFKVSD